MTGPKGQKVAELVATMDRLLAPDGCPWDREQTLRSLGPYLVEETYEVLDAIDRDDAGAHREELGDLLLQVVFQAAIREKDGSFDIDDVAAGIATKLHRRHPHVFGQGQAEDAEAVHRQWNAIKAQEKPGRRVLADVPRAMPALARAQKISSRAAGVGFDWPDVAGCRAKVEEELSELDAACTEGDEGAIDGELGDLLFAAVSLARKLGVDAESALRRATAKFERRFSFIEDRLAERGRSARESNLDEMDALWNESKTRE